VDKYRQKIASKVGTFYGLIKDEEIFNSFSYSYYV